jgi:hypothetical protein
MDFLTRCKHFEQSDVGAVGQGEQIFIKYQGIFSRAFDHFFNREDVRTLL